MTSDARKLADMLVLTRNDSEAMLRAAVEAFSAGQLSQAETILVGLMTINDDDPRPVKLLASCLLLQDRHREAETAYERAFELDADDPYTLVALAEIKLKTLKLDEAISLFEKLFGADPDGRHPAANRGRRLIRDYHAKLTGSK